MLAALLYYSFMKHVFVKKIDNASSNLLDFFFSLLRPARHKQGRFFALRQFFKNSFAVFAAGTLLQKV